MIVTVDNNNCFIKAILHPSSPNVYKQKKPRMWEKIKFIT